MPPLALRLIYCRAQICWSRLVQNYLRHISSATTSHHRWLMLLLWHKRDQQSWTAGENCFSPVPLGRPLCSASTAHSKFIILYLTVQIQLPKRSSVLEKKKKKKPLTGRFNKLTKCSTQSATTGVMFVFQEDKDACLLSGYWLELQCLLFTPLLWKKNAESAEHIFKVHFLGHILCRIHKTWQWK